MKLCCVFGQASNGKTEIAKYLVRRINEVRKNNDWSVRSFAKPVKQIYMDTFGVDAEFIDKWKRSPEVPPGFDLPVRQSLQLIGDGFRKIFHNVWVNIALKNANLNIIDDGRYFSEGRALKEKKGFNILVWRPGFENSDTNLSEAEIHPLVNFCKHYYGMNDQPIVRRTDINDMFGSSLPVEDFDFFIVNDGDLNHLYSKLDSLIIPLILNAI